MTDRELLWCACRHHIGERILVHSWDSLKIEASRSPEISLFKRFKENFDMLTYTNVNTRDLSIPETLPQWESKRQAIVDFCNLSLGEGFARGDYAELAKLTLIYLNASKEQNVTIYRPGASHKARFMSKLIYSLKIVLMSNQISNHPAGTILAAG